ncbi:MAG: hypothetical protein ABL886_14755 [Rhodoglobus sp.]
MSTPPTPPSRRDRTKPAELLILSAVMALFVGLVVLMSTRQVELALIFLGVTFIVALVSLAMLSLAMRPSGDEQLDLTEQDDAQRGDGPNGH